MSQTSLTDEKFTQADTEPATNTNSATDTTTTPDATSQPNTTTPTETRQNKQQHEEKEAETKEKEKSEVNGGSEFESEERITLDQDRVDRDELGSVEQHSAVEDIDIEAMELETNADGWNTFPHPEHIRAHLDENVSTDQSVLPKRVRETIDALIESDETHAGDFLVFDAEAAYDYLETLQWQSDLHLENFHRSQLVVNQLSNGRGYAKGASLSTYDKKWICEWEVRRRLAERDELDSWGQTVSHKLSKENHGLPNADD